MTAEVVAQLSVDDARRLTERIRLTAHSARESIEKLHALVGQAKTGRAHTALGYDSWTAYLADVLSEEPLRLARDQRQELVGYLAGEGMSTRAIAPIVGVSVGTVHHDRVSGVQNRTPEPVGPEPAEAAAPEPEPPATPRPVVTGLDGKTYQRSEPAAAPRRRSLVDQFFDAALDLDKLTARLDRLANDDRFPQNAEKVAANHRNDLLRFRDLLSQVIDRLPSATS